MSLCLRSALVEALASRGWKNLDAIVPLPNTDGAAEAEDREAAAGEKFIKMHDRDQVPT